MTRRRIAFLAAGGAAVVAAVIWLMPLGLRQIGFFRVRQVEFVGLRYLFPDTVLARIELEHDRNVFDPLGPVEERLAEVPGILEATISRRLPGTLRIAVREDVPVAFARGREGLVPLDAEAHPLPYDPAQRAFDLPIVERPDRDVARVLGLVRRVDPAMYGEIDGARRGSGESVILELGTRRILLSAAADDEDIRDVETVRLHLSRNDESFREIDARFAGWVVVRRERA